MNRVIWEREPHPEVSYAKSPCISALRSKKVANYVREHLDRWRLYHFHDTSSTSPMKKTVDINDNRYLRPDGSNLAAFLYFLREKHNTSYSLIRRTVQEAVAQAETLTSEQLKREIDAW